MTTVLTDYAPDPLDIGEDVLIEGLQLALRLASWVSDVQRFDGLLALTTRDEPDSEDAFADEIERCRLAQHYDVAHWIAAQLAPLLADEPGPPTPYYELLKAIGAENPRGTEIVLTS